MKWQLQTMPQFIPASALMLGVFLNANLRLNAQAPVTLPATPQPNAAAKVEDNLDWHDVTKWGLEGREWSEQPRLRYFDRLPAAAEKTVTGAVWNLSRDSAGMMVRFKTDAPAIHVHYKLSKNRLAMPHM